MEYILPRLESVDRVTSDPLEVDVGLNFLISKSAKACWVSRTVLLCLKICTIGKIKVVSSMVINPGTNLKIGVSHIFYTNVISREPTT